MTELEILRFENERLTLYGFRACSDQPRCPIASVELLAPALRVVILTEELAEKIFAFSGVS